MNRERSPSSRPGDARIPSRRASQDDLPAASESGARIRDRIRCLILGLGCVLFLVVGLQILVAAYDLSDPFHFVMTFFASNLIILVSLALLAGVIFRMARPRGSAGRDDDAPPAGE